MVLVILRERRPFIPRAEFEFRAAAAEAQPDHPGFPDEIRPVAGCPKSTAGFEV